MLSSGICCSVTATAAHDCLETCSGWSIRRGSGGAASETGRRNRLSCLDVKWSNKLMDSPIHKVRRNVGYLTYPRRNGAPEPLCQTSHHLGAHVASPHGRNVTIVSRAADCRSGPASLWSRGGTACPRRWMRCVGRHPLPCRTSGTLRPPCPLSAVKIAGHGADSPPRGAAWCAGDETVSRWSSPLLRGAQLKRRAGRRCHPLKEAFVASVRAGNFNEGCCRVSSPFRGWNPLSRQEKL